MPQPNITSAEQSCPDCDYVNDGAADFCINCGEELSGGALERILQAFPGTTEVNPHVPSEYDPTDAPI